MTQPLEGVTVVALEQAVAAPLATRNLADLGARVVKVERTDVGDFAREYDHAVHGTGAHFVWLNRGKESLAVDLQPEVVVQVRRVVPLHHEAGLLAGRPAGWFAGAAQVALGPVGRELAVSRIAVSRIAVSGLAGSRHALRVPGVTAGEPVPYRGVTRDRPQRNSRKCECGKLA